MPTEVHVVHEYTIDGWRWFVQYGKHSECYSCLPQRYVSRSDAAHKAAEFAEKYGFKLDNFFPFPSPLQ